MLKGAKRWGIELSEKRPERCTRLKSESKTSIRAWWKSAAYRNVPDAVLAIVRPLKIARGTMAPTCASVDGGGGGTPGFQPVTSPTSESKRKAAGPLAAPECTTNPGVPLKTCPVGAPPGIFTTSPAFWMGLPLTKPG